MKVEAMEEPTLTPSLTKVGEPVWKVGDIHQFTARADTFDTFIATLNEIFPPDEYCTPSALPHDNLTGEAMTAAGYEDSAVYVPSAIDANPNGIIIGVRLLPDPGEIGSSLDVESGPILPISLLPIHADWAWTREDKSWTLAPAILTAPIV